MRGVVEGVGERQLGRRLKPNARAEEAEVAINRQRRRGRDSLHAVEELLAQQAGHSQRRGGDRRLLDVAPPGADHLDVVDALVGFVHGENRADVRSQGARPLDQPLEELFILIGHVERALPLETVCQIADLAGQPRALLQRSVEAQASAWRVTNHLAQRLPGGGVGGADLALDALLGDLAQFAQ